MMILPPFKKYPSTLWHFRISDKLLSLI